MPEPTDPLLPKDFVQRNIDADEWDDFMRKQIKELMEEKPKPPGADAAFGRGQRGVGTEPDVPGAPSSVGRAQRNIPTQPELTPGRTVVDPDFAKPRVMPTPDKPTQIVPPGERPTARLPPSQRPTTVMPRGGAPTAPASPSPSPASARPIRPSSPEGLERIAQRLPKDAVEEARAAARQLARSRGWRRFVPGPKAIAAGLVGAIVGMVAFAVIDYAIDEALRKMGGGYDLSALLPGHGTGRTVPVLATFTRMSRDSSDPDFEPNVVNEDIIVTSPVGGATVIGIPFDGLPEISGFDIHVNRLGKGNSDWLCQLYRGYFICWSTSGAHPLVKGVPTVVSVQFHLPGAQMRDLLSTRSGTLNAYVIVPR